MTGAPLLLHVFPSFAMGGAQARFCTLANRFGPAYRHAVVALDGERKAEERLDGALELVWPAVGIRKGALAANLAECRQVLRTLRPDVLVTSNWGSIEWALANLLGGVRHVHVEDGFGPEERVRQLQRRVWTRRLALRRATVVLPSRSLLDLAAQRWRLPRTRLRYIPNGVAAARFAGGRLPPPVAWNAEGAPVIGTVAALRPEKNLGRLLRAFARLSAPAHLVILGDGPERASLEALSQSLGVAARVHFAGHVTDPSAAYRSFDVFALSSDTEQMPLSVLEAMASGLPVAATDVGDVRRMVSDGNVRFVVPRDDAALAGALGALITAPARSAAIGDANRAHASAEFGEAAMLRAWRGVFDGHEGEVA